MGWERKKKENEEGREGGRMKEIFKEKSKELQRRNFKFSL